MSGAEPHALGRNLALLQIQAVVSTPIRVQTLRALSRAPDATVPPFPRDGFAPMYTLCPSQGQARRQQSARALRAQRRSFDSWR